MLCSCLIVSKESDESQVPYVTQAPIVMMSRGTLHSPQLILPHAGILSSWDRTQALTLHVSSEARFVAVFKLRKSTTNAASSTLNHNTNCTTSTDTASSITPNEQRSIRACSSTLCEYSLGRAGASEPPRRRSSHTQSSTSLTGQRLKGNHNDTAWQLLLVMRRIHSKVARRIVSGFST